MKHLSLLLLLHLFVSGLFAQKTTADTVALGFDGQLLGCTPDIAVFTGYAVRTAQGWTAVIYDDSLKVVARGNYLSQKCKEKEGWFTFYYPDGKRAASGQFHRDKRYGIWRTWYPEGRIRDSINYDKGIPAGYYFSYYASGKLSTIGKFNDGLEDSTWTWYHQNGKIASLEEYKKGTLKGQRCLDSNGLVKLENCRPYLEPMTSKKETIWQVVYDSLKVPIDKNGRPMEGKVMVNIDITERGEVRQMAVVPGAYPILDSLVAKALSQRKQWTPAYDHNRPIAYAGIIVLPINQKAIATGSLGPSRAQYPSGYNNERPWYADRMSREPERFTPYGFLPGNNKIDQ